MNTCKLNPLGVVSEYSRIFEVFYRILYSDRLIPFNTQHEKVRFFLNQSNNPINQTSLCHSVRVLP